MTLGSLFDGIGGFPLAGTYCGISPVWASEIEPAPVSITKRHFPEMKHLGDITKINGENIEPVDIITFGSPCQDLSVAGKRAGLKHEGKGDEETTRSGLFMEAVRIIREMMEATNGEYPTFAVWENVPGAFSSNKGEDFRIVLEEICKVKDGNAVIPRPAKGKWSDAGCIMADGYSIAWRVLDAQFWGVPQRRRRIYLVADFAGQRAGEILFKPESVSGHSASRRAQGQGTASDAERSIGAASNGGIGIICAATQQGGAEIREDNISPTLTAAAGMSGNNQPYFAAYCLQGNGIDRSDTAGCNGKGWTEDVCDTLNTVDRPAVCSVQQNARGEVRVGEVDCTLNTNSNANGRNAPLVCAGFNGHKSAQADITYGEELCPTLESNMPTNVLTAFTQRAFRDYQEGAGTLTRSAGQTGCSSETIVAIDCRNHCVNDVSCTLQAKENGGQSLNYINPICTYSRQRSDELIHSDISSTLSARDYKSATDLVQTNAVRRLTPLECERLQGFPDGWTEQGHDGKPISDSARYKALGNSLAIPCAFFVLHGTSIIAKKKTRPPQLAPEASAD